MFIYIYILYLYIYIYTVYIYIYVCMYVHICSRSYTKRETERRRRRRRKRRRREVPFQVGKKPAKIPMSDGKTTRCPWHPAPVAHPRRQESLAGFGRRFRASQAELQTYPTYLYIYIYYEYVHIQYTGYRHFRTRVIIQLLFVGYASRIPLSLHCWGLLLHLSTKQREV